MGKMAHFITIDSDSDDGMAKSSKMELHSPTSKLHPIGRRPLASLTNNSLSSTLSDEITSIGANVASNVIPEPKYVLDYEKAVAICSRIDSITRQGVAIFN